MAVRRNEELPTVSVMEYLTPPSKELFDPLFGTGYHTNELPASSLLSLRTNRRHVGHNSVDNSYSARPPTNKSSPRKLTRSGFLPLPSITASPICTPSSTISSHSSISDEGHAIAHKDAEDFTPAPASSGQSSPVVSLLVSAPPTWVSTPPTPPSKPLKRSTTLTRPFTPFPSSASFPASISPHAPAKTDRLLKRRASIPLGSSRPRASSDSSAELMRPDYHATERISPVIASPLQVTFIAAAADKSQTSSARNIRLRPMFHIEHVPCTSDDTSHHLTESPEQTHEEFSMDGSWSENGSDDIFHSEKVKDDVRKYYALKELLVTEVGYLLDLRALVTVYFRILPILISRTPGSPFSRASSFTSGPWVNHAPAFSSPIALPDNTAHAKEQTKSFARYLFTDQEVELLTRNAEELLQLHEHFVQELRADLAPLGFHMHAPHGTEGNKCQGERIQNTDAAIRAVSTKFATEASRFNSYQTFCVGHAEALDLVRKVQSQHPLEWDAYEQRCSSLVIQLGLSTTVDPGTPDSQQPPSPAESETAFPSNKGRNRAGSFSSIDGAVRTLRSRASSLSPRDSLTIPFEPRKDKGPPRLALMDYMIKPVQRICKYPLILDQLKPGKSLRALSPAHLRSDVDVVVESAAQAMRHVASSVDEARHRQDVAIQSALIVSRISLASPTMSQMTSVHPAFQTLTTIFLSSLGTCLLAGSLDVMHSHMSQSPGGSSIQAKYLGAFLYPGGYLILVKVSKGKVYEPRHWFSLGDFDISEREEGDAMLPCSFRLSFQDHRFEMAAACQREKDAWIASIRESLTQPPTWINEPTSSLEFDGKGELIASGLDDGPFEAINALPTIQSIPELAGNSSDPQITESVLATLQSDIKEKVSSKLEFPIRQDPEPPSRRSSTASVKGIFAPSESDTIIIRRSSSSARSRVDVGLQDVISQVCLTARLYATSREEELFQAPKISRSGFVHSHPGLTMAGMAKNRLTRHESIRILRRKSLLDRPNLLPSKQASSSQSLATRRRSKHLGITPLPEFDNRFCTRNSDPLSSSQTSSATASTPHSASGSPIQRAAILETPGGITEATTPLKSSRSFVDNVKGFFGPRSSSPVSLTPATSNQSFDVESHANKTLTPGSINLWAKCSLHHRRTRSAPEVPDVPLPSSTNSEVVDTQKLNVGAPILLSCSSSAIPDQRLTQHPFNHKASRRRSFLSSSLRCSFAEMNSTRGTKNQSLLQRLKA